MGRFRYTAAAVCVAVSMLAGCGGPQPLIGNSGAMPQGRAITTRPDVGRSWMKPEAKSEDLLYIGAVGRNASYVFTYPRFKLVGMLDSGGGKPCTDSNGNVSIPSFAPSENVEFHMVG